MLSKLKPAAGVSITFDSAIGPDWCVFARLGAPEVAVCKRHLSSLTFDFGVKMEKHSADTQVKGVSTGVSKWSGTDLR